ncbi:glycosyltransferase [Capnocytophaga ochracea]|nr:glycosyltransferase [Capnocytophaga ochracea]
MSVFGEIQNHRRETKNIKRWLEGFLVKKGCKEGGVSL